jgi:hypothetical protein
MTTEPTRQPWWKRGLFAALLGAAIPAATFVQGWWQSRRELQLQERAQLQQIRMAYMNLMVEGGVDRVEMLADFIADTEQDLGIRSWAEKQREKARATVKVLEARIADEQKRSVTAEGERRAAEERATRAEAEAKRLAEKASGDRAEKERAEKAAEDARAAAASADSNARVTEAKVARSRETLHGRPNARVEVPYQQMQMPEQRALPPDTRRAEPR